MDLLACNLDQGQPESSQPGFDGPSSLAPLVDWFRRRQYPFVASVRLRGKHFKPLRSYWFAVRAVFPLVEGEAEGWGRRDGGSVVWAKSAFSPAACMHTPAAAPTLQVVEALANGVRFSFAAPSVRG